MATKPVTMSESSQYFYSDYDVSEVKSKIFVYTWKVIDFRYLNTSIGPFISAPIIKRKDKKIWRIYLYPEGGGPEANKEYVSVELTFFGHEKQKEFFKNFSLSICIIDVNGKECEIYKLYNAKKQKIIIIDTLIKKDFLLDEKNGLLPNGDLTLRFKAYATEKVVDRPKLTHSASCLNKSTFLELDSILNTEKFSDVKIGIDDRVFHVYKGILASRSPVFAAMFEHDMEENIENIVKITDVKCEIMQEVLRFMYSGKVNNIKDIATDLLVAADKYQVKELKMLCEDELINNLNIDNVTNLLIHAEKYEAKNLKPVALEFFKIHAKEIIKSEKYKADLENLLPVLPDVVEILV